jgi:hypothetical protein
MYSIELARTRKKKKSEGAAPMVLERKITYLPQAVTSLDLSCAPSIGPGEEDWTPLAGKDGSLFDATARTDCEMLEYAFQKGVPDVLQKAVKDAAKPAPSKKKSFAIQLDNDDLSPKPARKRKASVEKENLEASAQPKSRTKKAKKADALTEVGASGAADAQPKAPRPTPALRMPPTWTDINGHEREGADPFEDPRYLSDIRYLRKHPSVGQSIGRSAERRPPSESEMAVVDRVMAVIHEGVARRVSSEVQISQSPTEKAKELLKPREKSRKSNGGSMEDAIVLD